MVQRKGEKVIRMQEMPSGAIKSAKLNSSKANNKAYKLELFVFIVLTVIIVLYAMTPAWSKMISNIIYFQCSATSFVIYIILNQWSVYEILHLHYHTFSRLEPKEDQYSEEISQIVNRTIMDVINCRSA